MPKIFQSFELVLPKDEDELQRAGEKGPDKWKTLCQKLKERGYMILISNGFFCGITKSIIVGAESDSPSWRNIKRDFYQFVSELGLTFRSGPWYGEPAQ